MSARPVCVVTGATGLVGRHLLPQLAVTHDVIALARTPGPEAPHVRWLGADLADSGWTSMLPPRYEVAIHLAQSRRFREFPHGAGDVLRINVDALERLATHAVGAGASHLVHLSTGGVYAPAVQPVAESAALHAPLSAGWYVGSKLAAEALVMSYRTHLVPIVLRPFFVYGAGQSRDMLVPRLADSVRDGRPIVLSSETGIRVSLTHADDMAQAVVGALALASPVAINVAGPDALTIREIAETFGRLHGATPVFQVSTPVAPSYDLVADTRLAGTLLAPLPRAFAPHAASLLS